MMIMPKKTYQGRISFGAYNGPESAEMRKASLAKKGIDANVVARKEQEQASWLEVKDINEAKRDAILLRLDSL